VGTVSVEIGPKFGDDRQTQPAGRRQCRPTQRTLGGDMDDIRPTPTPAPLQRQAGWQTQSQSGIAGNGHPDRQPLGESFVGVEQSSGIGPPSDRVTDPCEPPPGIDPGLSGTDQLDAVPFPSQA
jgi:hypothetical protein